MQLIWGPCKFSTARHFFGILQREAETCPEGRNFPGTELPSSLALLQTVSLIGIKGMRHSFFHSVK